MKQVTSESASGRNKADTLDGLLGGTDPSVNRVHFEVGMPRKRPEPKNVNPRSCKAGDKFSIRFYRESRINFTLPYGDPKAR